MLRLYRWLLHLYPVGFREEYARAMEQAFRDDFAETPNQFAAAWLVLHTLGDLAVSVPTQFALEMWRDSKHAVRLWRKQRWYTGFAVLALALSIGANTGVFSVVNALLLRSLPFHDPERLAAVEHLQPPHDTAAQFEQWRKHSNYFEDAALFEEGDFNIGDAQRMLRAHTAQASLNFFALLGVQPLVGRTFAGDDSGVAVISYPLWQELYAGTDRAIGSTVRLNGVPLRIIGVMPAGFNYPTDTLLWKSADYAPGNNGWRSIVRLRHDENWRQARAAFLADVERLEPHRRFRPDWIPFLIPLRDQLAGPVKNASLLLLAAVLLILLIACANLTNLLLARTADRRHELAIRSAMGASRARLVQQLLTECLLLVSLSAVGGLAVAFWVTSVASKLEPGALPSQTYSILDGRVLAFMLGLTVGSAFLFGALPALGVARLNQFAARGSGGLEKARWLRESLVAAQVMLTVVLLTASVSVMTAFSHQLRIDRGFKADGLVTASVSLDGTVREGPGVRLQYFEEVLGRVRRVPGVQSASATEFLPLASKGFIGGPYSIDGQRSKPGTGTDILPVMADYFRTTGGRVLYGREFSDSDVRSKAKVALVNLTFARMFARPEDAVGHVLTDPDGQARKIIGVVSNVDFMGQFISDVFDVDPPETFIPDTSPGSFESTIVVKVNGEAKEYLPALRRVMESVDKGVPVFDVETMQQRMNMAFGPPRFYRTALVFFAAFALLLAALGIFAVASSQSLSVRTRSACGWHSGQLRRVCVPFSWRRVYGVSPLERSAELQSRYLQVACSRA